MANINEKFYTFTALSLNLANTTIHSSHERDAHNVATESFY